jgi:hypothetical protein
VIPSPLTQMEPASAANLGSSDRFGP